MSDVLCIYYSRTGRTKKAIEEVAQALNADIVELQDTLSGRPGWLRCGLDAMRRKTRPVQEVKIKQPLKTYRLVILGTPVWAGRCSAVMRSFLKQYGSRMTNVAFLITRSSEKRYEEVFSQMDMYVPDGHKAAVSLRDGSVGYAFWQEEFLRQVREYLNEQ